MKRFFASLFSAALFATISVTAQPHAAAIAADSMGSMSSMSSMKCPAGQTYVKGYMKADKTKVAGYCRKSEMKSSMMMTCPAGEMMVKGYTKKDGTKVDSYCRKK